MILGPGAARVDWVGRAKAHAFFALQDDLREVLGTDVDLVMVPAVKNRSSPATSNAPDCRCVPRSAAECTDLLAWVKATG